MENPIKFYQTCIKHLLSEYETEANNTEYPVRTTWSGWEFRKMTDALMAEDK
jgi:hypothetical protein